MNWVALPAKLFVTEDGSAPDDDVTPKGTLARIVLETTEAVDKAYTPVFGRNNGTATFDVTTTNIPNGKKYAIEVTGAPDDVTVADENDFEIKEDKGVLTLNIP